MFRTKTRRNHHFSNSTSWSQHSATTHHLLLVYCHIGSLSQPTGKPRALLSISGKQANNLFNFSHISLFGDMVSRKYLIMQML